MAKPRILGSLTALRAFLQKKSFSGVYLVTSKSLANTLGFALRELHLPKKNLIFIPDGEGAKEWGELEKLLTNFRTRGVDRNSIILALGGGTVGDMAGFAASIYLRGVAYIQVPTTLLAQVDSAHGGKTGINFRGSKNQIGTTYDPLAIVLEPKFLTSLKEAQIIDGLGEIIKAGLIKDTAILSLLSKEHAATLATSKHLPAIIHKAVRVKSWYTTQDQREKNIRQMLNFGHTIGHALELAHRISHGRAVIEGMLRELTITEAMGYTHPSVRKNLLKLLENLGIRTTPSLAVDTRVIRADKKISGHMLNLPVVEKAGTSSVVQMPLAKFIASI